MCVQWIGLREHFFQGSHPRPTTSPHQDVSVRFLPLCATNPATDSQPYNPLVSVFLLVPTCLVLLFRCFARGRTQALETTPAPRAKILGALFLFPCATSPRLPTLPSLALLLPFNISTCPLRTRSHQNVPLYLSCLHGRNKDATMSMWRSVFLISCARVGAPSALPRTSMYQQTAPL